MTRVLLSIDKDESRARAQARRVLNLFGPEDLSVTLMHVFEDNPEGATVQQLAAIRRAKEILEDAGVETTAQGESGEPAERIVDFADELDVDAICIAGRKRSPAGKVVFGSTTQGVILGTDRPVLVCSPEEDM